MAIAVVVSAAVLAAAVIVPAVVITVVVMVGTVVLFLLRLLILHYIHCTIFQVLAALKHYLPYKVMDILVEKYL